MSSENNEMNVQEPAKNKQKQNMKKMIAIAAGLVLVFVLVMLFKGLSSDSALIQSSDLVQESSGGISFKRPLQWQEVELTEEGIDVAFTEKGESLESSNQGMLLSSEELGVNYNDLTDTQKSVISKSFKNQFSKKESLENGSCQEISDIKTDEVTQTTYDTAFKVAATCGKFAGTDAKATIKMLIGIKDSTINVVGVIAVNETWDKSGAALDEIIDSVQPAN